MRRRPDGNGSAAFAKTARATAVSVLVYGLVSCWMYVIGTVGAIVYPMDNITDFLYLIGSVFAPMIAVQIADFFFLKRDAGDKQADPGNLLIWFAGFVLYRILMRADIPVGNTLPDMVITVALCLVFRRGEAAASGRDVPAGAKRQNGGK